MTVRRKAVYDTRFFATLYYSRNRMRRKGLDGSLLGDTGSIVVSVDSRIARKAAAIWCKHRVPMADAIIVATVEVLKAECVTNDPHLKSISEVRSRWI